MQLSRSQQRKSGTSTRLTWSMSFRKYGLVYLMLLPAVVFVLVFSYFPMPGILVAFKDFDIFKGLFGSPWTSQSGFGHFIKLFSLPEIPYKFIP